MIILKSERELELMREPGNIVGQTLAMLKNEIAPGVTTEYLDEIAEKFIRDNSAVPAFKGYNGFPASVCSSVNEQVVHGIPGLRKLNSGDIISIDVGAVKNGYCGDAAITVAVGEVEPEVEDLIRVTQEALFKGIENALVGNRLSDISHAVQTYAEKNGLSVVRDYVGHGIGKNMHEDPQIPNFGSPGRGPRLSAGMVLAIEPMLNLGTYEVETLEDNWTVVTKDRKYSAHFEHTVAITDEGPQIFTKQ